MALTTADYRNATGPSPAWIRLYVVVLCSNHIMQLVQDFGDRDSFASRNSEDTYFAANLS